MKSLLAAVLLCLGASALAAEPATNSAVEARLDALEKIDVTAAKPARANDEANDAQIDAILDQAARAEVVSASGAGTTTER